MQRHLRQKLSDWLETKQSSNQKASANHSNETKHSFISVFVSVSVSVSAYMIAYIPEIWLFGGEIETETETETETEMKLKYHRIAATYYSSTLHDFW